MWWAFQPLLSLLETIAVIGAILVVGALICNRLVPASLSDRLEAGRLVNQKATL